MHRVHNVNFVYKNIHTYTHIGTWAQTYTCICGWQTHFCLRIILESNCIKMTLDQSTNIIEKPVNYVLHEVGASNTISDSQRTNIFLCWEQQRQEDKVWSLDMTAYVHRAWQDQPCFRQWWALYCQEKAGSSKKYILFLLGSPRQKHSVCLQWWRLIPEYKNTKSHTSYPTSLRIMLWFKCIGQSGSP